MAELHQLVSQKLLTIAGAVIQQDAKGRYCLNDLHRAAGGEERHSPNRWTRTDGYKSLVAELTPEMAFAPEESVRGGTDPGTYVVKELVYAFAMWISPSFHLKVIRAYDAMLTKPVLPVVSTGEIERIARSQLGGIMKSVVHKEIQDALNSILPALVHGELAKHQMSVRRGHTAGQVWNTHGLPKVKGAAVMLSKRLENFGCMIDGDGRAEMGGRTAKLFDPDKASKAMKSGLLDFCQKYVMNRNGQHSLFPLKSV